MQIISSVGKNARNLKADVITIQTLLNRHLPTIGRKYPLVVDGKIGPKTINAIIRFQQRVVGLNNYDGRVDPGGQTLLMLNNWSRSAAIRGRVHDFIVLPQSDAFRRYSLPNRQWGTRYTINNLTFACYSLDGKVKPSIGDISLQRGGRMRPHTSHRTGVDVDIRPQRKDGVNRPVSINDPMYDRSSTAKVVKALRQTGEIHVILFNDETIPGVKFWKGHHNHLHVRFKK